MKILDKLTTNHVSGGYYTDVVPAGMSLPGYIFSLHGNCNITASAGNHDLLWDGSNMILGIPYEVTVETTQFGDFVSNSTYRVTKYHDKCQFEHLPQLD